MKQQARKKNSKKEQAKVSIIIPAYNAEKYLEDCLNSIVRQTMREIEIICIDDGSTDKTLEIMNRFARLDKRIKVIHKKNSGYGNSMNMGINIATGQYIGIVESDDYIESDMCEVLYKIAIEKNVDIVKSNFSRFYGEGIAKNIEKVPITNDVEYYNRIITPKKDLYVFNFLMNIVTGLYRRSFLKQNKITFNETPGAAFQDNGFWIKTYLLAEKIYFVDEYFYRCRRDNPNSSVKLLDKAFIVAKEYDLILEWLKKDKDLYDFFIEKFIYLQCIGYFSVYARSDLQHKLEFLMYFSKKYNKYLDEGLINRWYYGPIVYEKLNKIISNPIEFFLKDIKIDAKSLELWKSNKIEENYKKYLCCLEKLKDAENKLMVYDLEKQIETKNIINTLHKERTELMPPFVSVIIPVYNMENFIGETLNSVICQTLSNIEIICVDDGSTDNTYHKIIEYAKYDTRFFVISIKNQGAGHARNVALDVAKGKYILFMDGDDFYPENDTIEFLYNKIEENKVNICGGGVVTYINGKIEKEFGNQIFEKEEVIEYKDYQFDYGYTRYIYNREFLIYNNIYFPNYLRFQDPPFFVKAMITAGRFLALDKVVYIYRKSHKKVNWTSEKCLNMMDGCLDILIMANNNNLDNLYQKIVQRVTEEYIKIIVELFYDDKILNKFVDICNFINEKNNSMNLVRVNPWKQVYILQEQAYNKKLLAEKETHKLIKQQVESLEQQVENAKKELEISCKTICDLEYQLYQTRISFTYKIGRIITYIPRKIRTFAKKEKNVKCDKLLSQQEKLAVIE